DRMYKVADILARHWSPIQLSSNCHYGKPYLGDVDGAPTNVTGVEHPATWYRIVSHSNSRAKVAWLIQQDR
ncbi:hypothetical protein HAX54_004065, partial [Datura stramonium]|nr:hypothetical protein [Datura stramonium]